MRVCDLRIRIVRDGHEPNEAEEQRPCRVPIEPVHVISSPKDRREQAQVPIYYIARARLSSRDMMTRSHIALRWPLASPSASAIIATPSAFSATVPDGATSGTRSSKISVIMLPPCAQAPVKALVPGLLPPCSRQLYSSRALVPGDAALT